MVAWELLRSIMSDLLRHKLRTFLAMFGIIWGTLAVILLLAMGEGFYRANSAGFSRLIDGAIVVSPGVTTKPYRGNQSGRIINLNFQQALEIEKSVPGIKVVAPTVGKQLTVVQGATQITGKVVGTVPAYAQISQRHALPGGRFINHLDIEHASRVAFINASANEKLFPHQDAVGKSILIAGLPFTVIGVQDEPENTGWHQNGVIIPYTTGALLWGDDWMSNVMIAPEAEGASQALVRDVTRMLSRRYQFAEDDVHAMQIYNPEKAVQFFSYFFRGIQLFLGLCGGLTLAVGGLGVANLMYLIVSERTPEIGLRMAMGARTYHILLQILSEALLIVSIASVIGITIAYSVTSVLTKIGMPDWLGAPVISKFVILITVSVLLIVAILAGLLPARRAARLHPVEALAF